MDKQVFLKFIVIILLLTGRFSSCEKNDIDVSKVDFSNIENLYEQPLPIIQECVLGKWQLKQISRWGIIGLIFPTNTFVEIKENRVELTGDIQFVMNGCLNNSFSYSWEIKKVYPFGLGIRPACYTTYVMQNNDQKIEGWYFDKITNDTLSVSIDYGPDISDYEVYLLLRISNNNH